MEAMATPRALYAAVMLKAKAVFSDMDSHQSKWLNTGHLKRSKSFLKDTRKVE